MMWNWLRPSQKEGAPNAAGVSAAEGDVADLSVGLAVKATLSSPDDTSDVLDESDAPNQSGRPEPWAMGARGLAGGGSPASSAGCGAKNNGDIATTGSCGGTGASSTGEPEPEAVGGAREQVLLSASDELEYLFKAVGVDHYPVLEAVCSMWRAAIVSARKLGHEYLLYPSEAYPQPRTPGGIKSPSGVCALPGGELVVTDTGERARGPKAARALRPNAPCPGLW